MLRLIVQEVSFIFPRLSVIYTVENSATRFISSRASREDADGFIAQYLIPNGTTAFPGNQLGIFESANDHYSRQELDVYFSTLYP